MTGTIGNGDVEVMLDAGSWIARWPAVGDLVGPCTACIELADRVVRFDTAAGEWTTERGEAFGRAGTWARWAVATEDAWVAIHVPDSGPVIVVDAGMRRAAPAVLERITLVDGEFDLGGGARLVDGYDGCAYSGVRSTAEPGTSYWNTAFVRDGRAIAIQALTAHRLCTAVTSAPVGDRVAVRVDCGASPELVQLADSGSYRSLEPGGLHLPVDAHVEVRAEPCAIAAGNDPLGVVEDLAAMAAQAMGAWHWDGPPLRGWESWYHFGLLAIDAPTVVEQARILRERYADRPGFDLVQIDDGWQRTYGGWWPNERFPDDLAQVTSELRALGCRPGLWLAPFMVQPGAPGLGTEHPEWMITDDAGAPLVDRHGRWGLDATDPEALAWLHDLGSQVRCWDVDMVKLDFCFIGAREGRRHDQRVTGVEAMRRGLRVFLDGLGDGVYVLVCIAPLLAQVGLSHACRVGIDLGTPVLLREFGAAPPLADWTSFAGIRAGAREVAARWATHGRWFANDPDVVMALGADRHPCGYTADEVRTLATLALMTGGPYLLADDLGALRDEERALLEHPAVLDLLGPEGFRPLDLFEVVDDAGEDAYSQAPDLASVWSTRRAGRELVALFNWGDAPVVRPVPDGFSDATEVWTGSAVEGATLGVPAHGVRVLVRRAEEAVA